MTREPETIMVGVDGSLAAHAALRWAADHAQAGDTLSLVHVWEPSPSLAETGRDAADDRGVGDVGRHELARAQLLTRGRGIEVTCAVLTGDPRSRLCEERPDLLVVGAGGHGPITGKLLGSVSSHLAQHCAVPLVIVPAHAPRADST